MQRFRRLVFRDPVGTRRELVPCPPKQPRQRGGAGGIEISTVRWSLLAVHRDIRQKDRTPDTTYVLDDRAPTLEQRGLYDSGRMAKHIDLFVSVDETEHAKLLRDPALLGERLQHAEMRLVAAVRRSAGAYKRYHRTTLRA